MGLELYLRKTDLNRINFIVSILNTDNHDYSLILNRILILHRCQISAKEEVFSGFGVTA